MPVVVGILPNAAAASKLADAIKAAELDLSDLTIIADDMPDDALITNGVKFRQTGEPDTDTLDTGLGIITSSGGTEVPGLSRTPGIDLVSDPEDPLADLNVPDARIDDYEEALEAGRSVVGYRTADTDKVSAIFVAAGANPVEVF